MAAVAVAAKLEQPVGHYLPFVTGVTLMASGTATVQLGHMLSVVKGAVGNIANASTGVGEMVTFSFSGTAMVIETVAEGGTTTGTSLVSWMAWGIPKA